jgi:trehalose 6-phosphate phosphatase
VELLAERAPRCALLCDFDGTLAPIVTDPAAARPLGGAVETLHRLSLRLDAVAVVSGRPASFLAAQLWPGGRRPGAAGSRLRAFGLYGLEEVVGDRVVDTEPQLATWRAGVAAAGAELAGVMPPGTLLEPKGLTLGLHWRNAPDAGEDVTALAASAAARYGLVLRHGRLAAELVPPVEIDKGTVVRHLAAGEEAGSFIGDDLGDLPAFVALGELASTPGFVPLRVAVASPESPPALLAAADLVLEGPPEVLAMLEALEAALGQP